jgi:hypothetical protein
MNASLAWGSSFGPSLFASFLNTRLQQFASRLLGAPKQESGEPPLGKNNLSSQSKASLKVRRRRDSHHRHC